MKRLLLLLLPLLFVSCQRNVVFKQLDTDFDENRWLRQDVRTYAFEIEESGLYDLKVLLGYVAEVQFAKIPIELEWTDASGRLSYQNIVLQTKNDKGEERGDCLGDLCDLEQLAFAHKKLVAGHYKIKLVNGFNHEFLPNVTALGISIKKTAP